MRPLTQDEYRAFSAHMREAAAYITTCVTGRMQPITLNASKQRKQDKPKREE